MIIRSNEKISDLDCRLIVHPTAGGKIRGAHNCGKCDDSIIKAIENFSISGDNREFSGIDCSCKSVWKEEIDSFFSLPTPLGNGVFRRGDNVDILRAP